MAATGTRRPEFAPLVNRYREKSDQTKSMLKPLTAYALLAHPALVLFSRRTVRFASSLLICFGVACTAVTLRAVADDNFIINPETGPTNGVPFSSDPDTSAVTSTGIPFTFKALSKSSSGAMNSLVADEVTVAAPVAFYLSVKLTASLSTSIPLGSVVAFYQTDSDGASATYLGQVTNVNSWSVSLTVTPPAANVVTRKYFKAVVHGTADTWSNIATSLGYYSSDPSGAYVVYNGSQRPFRITQSSASTIDSTYYQTYYDAGLIQPGSFAQLSFYYLNLCLDYKPIRRAGNQGPWCAPSGTIDITEMRGGWGPYSIADGYQTIFGGFGYPAFIALGNFSSNTAPPQVTILSPNPIITNGPATDKVNVKCLVMAPQSPVTSLRILIDDVLLASTNANSLYSTQTLAASFPLGQHTLAVEVTDAAGATARDEQSCTVYRNFGVDIAFQCPAIVLQGSNVAFSVTATPAHTESYAINPAIASVYFYRNESNWGGSTNTANPYIFKASPPLGTNVIRVAVKDTSGVTSSTSKTCVVVALANPQVAFLSPGAYYPNTTDTNRVNLPVELTVSTPNPGGIITNIVITEGSTILSRGTNTLIMLSNVLNGLHVYKAQVTDSLNRSATATNTVTVTAPAPPIVVINQPVAGRTYTNYTVDPFTVPYALSVTDTNTGAAIASIEVYDGTNLIGNSLSGSFSTTNYGAHAIRARVTNNYNKAGAATNSINLRQELPTIQWVSPSGCRAFFATSLLPLRVSAKSSPADPIKNVQFFRDGVFIGEATQVPYLYNWPNPPDGEHTITATVTTSSNGTASASIPVTMAQIADWEIKDPSNPSDVGRQEPPSSQHYKLIANGKSTATARGLQGPLTFSWADPNKTLNCSLSAEGVLVASTNLGTVAIIATAGCSKTTFYFNLVGPECDACNAGKCPAQGTASANNHSVDIKIGLGTSSIDGSAGFLQIKEGQPSEALGTPAALRYAFIRPELETVTDAAGVLQQIKTQDGLITVTTNTASSYSLNFFNRAQVRAKTGESFVWAGWPTKVITIENVGDINHFRVTDSDKGIIADYEWSGDGWILITGNGMRREARHESSSGDERTIRTEIRDSANQLISSTIQVLKRYPLGENLIQSVEAGRTNSYDYDSQGHLIYSSLADGSWEIVQYDTNGRQSRRFSPFVNSPPTTNSANCRMTVYDYSNSCVAGSENDSLILAGTPRCMVSYVLGHEVSRNYAILAEGLRKDIQCVTRGALWNDPSNLVTATFYYTNALHYGQIARVIPPAGPVTDYQYGIEPLEGISCEKATTRSGALSPDGAFIQGTETAEYTEQSTKRRLLRVVTDIASQLVTASERYFYDEAGHVTNTVYLDGTQTSQVYDCCHLLTTADRNGIVTSYGYDALNRAVTTIRDGITTSNEFNADGNIVSSHRIGTDGSDIVTSRSTYDTAGSLTSSIDVLGNATTSSNYLNAAGQNVHTSTHLGITTVETQNFDGSVASNTSNAGTQSRYVYGIDSSTGESFTQFIRLNADGSDTGEWTKTYQDVAGRTTRVVYPDNATEASVYGANGQLSASIDADGVVTLYSYNALGETEYHAVDVNRNGQIDLAGPDRVTRTVTDVTAFGDYVVRRTQSFVFADDAGNPTLVSMTATAVNAQRSWNSSGGGTNQAYTVLMGNGSATSVTIAADGTTTSQYSLNGRLISSQVSDAAGTIQSMTRTYDARNRLLTVTDARNGTTTYTYNDADQVTAVTTPAPGDGNRAQTTSTVYDDHGRVWRTQLPDNTWTTNGYNLDGSLQFTTGSRTYPVAYTYDYAGRKQTMTTWGAAGPAVTTWNYNNRGLLQSKAYNDGTGPSYTYTPGGRLQTRTWARGVVTTYGYNAAGDKESIQYSDATPGFMFGYNRLGLPAVINGATATTMTYTSLGQLLQEDVQNSGFNYTNQLVNTYDSLQRLSTAAGTTIGYTGGRITSLTRGALQAAYGYEANSALISGIALQVGSGPVLNTIKSYDYLNRLQAVAATPGLGVTYAYNSANQRTALTNLDGSHWQYGYDFLGQVTTANKLFPDGQPAAGQQFEFGYDTIGNRTYNKVGGLHQANYSVNALNQYASREIPGFAETSGSANSNTWVWVNGVEPVRQWDHFWQEFAVNNFLAGVFTNLETITLNATSTNVAEDLQYVQKSPETFQYDLDGNLTMDGQWAYTWDAENRLVRMENLAVIPAELRLSINFTYDWQGRRIAKTVSQNGTVTSDRRFYYDGWNLTGEVDLVTGRSIGYTWGLDLSQSRQGAGGVGGLLAITVTNGELAGTYATAYDGNGNIIGLVNTADGTIAAQYEYGPFGEVLKAVGPLPALNPFGFSTKYRDAETGLLYYGYRYYIPSTGRWMSRDPIAENGGVNVNAMCNNNVLNSFDPNGQITVTKLTQAANNAPPYEDGVFLEVTWRFALENAIKQPGYIVQEIDQTTTYYDQEGNMHSAPAHYWEAWLVESNMTLAKWPKLAGPTDMAVAPITDTVSGTYVATGKIRFFPSSLTGDLGTPYTGPTAGSVNYNIWGPGKHPYSGLLPSSITEPTWWSQPSLDPEATRSVNATWHTVCNKGTASSDNNGQGGSNSVKTRVINLTSTP